MASLREQYAATYAERFWSRVRKSDGCWEWQGYIMPNGYGQVGRAGKNIYAHRASWEMHFGPSEKCVMHLCDNRICVRPDHLTVGTHADNSADMRSKNRQARGTRMPNARLTGEIATACRYASIMFGCTHQQLADAVGVRRETISLMLRRETWSHVP